MRPALSCCAFVLMLLALFSCGSPSGRGIPKGKVSGKVTYKNEPAEEGVVYLSSKETGIGATAVLGAGGQFSLADGIEVGIYQVSILPPTLPDDAGAPQVKGPPKLYPNIPEKYRNESTSGFSADVKKGANHFVFNME